MRIVKYNKGKKSSSDNITEQLSQIISQSNKLDDYFSFNNGVLVSNYDIASTGQVSSQYQAEEIEP